MECNTNVFMEKYLQTGIVKVDTADVVKIRKNSLCVSNTDQIKLTLVLNKAILDAFSYFNTTCPDNLLKLLISDIKEVYHQHSPIEILEAINQGRKKQDVKTIFGKLSAAHVMEWIRDFDNTNTERIVSDSHKRDQDAKDETNCLMHDSKGNFIFQPKEKPPEKKEFTKKEKSKELEYQLIYSKEERAIINHGRKWSFKKHGDYETYMRNFKK